MSTTATKRPLAKAIAEAEAFRDLCAGAYHRWEIAGSVRRHKPEVGDIEHVVIPDGNALWARLESLLPGDGLWGEAVGTIEKAGYPDGSHRWGEKYRGVMFRGFRHEIFAADALNWGAILAIRTGPAEFSQRLVTDIKRGGLRQDGGYVKDAHGNIVSVPDEATFLRLCGSAWIEPCDRV